MSDTKEDLDRVDDVVDLKQVDCCDANAISDTKKDVERVEVVLDCKQVDDCDANAIANTKRDLERVDFEPMDFLHLAKPPPSRYSYCWKPGIDVMGLDMPVLMIWSPKGDNKFGHAALQTEKYHMSFWPDGNVKDLGKTKAAVAGVPAALILHHERDKYLESNRNPVQYVIRKVTDEELDQIFEEFLQFNEIEPNHVAEVKAKVNRLIKSKQTSQLKKMIEDGEDVDLNVPKTQYTFLPSIMNVKNPSGLWTWLTHPGGNLSFPERAQSCTSFCSHLIELADKSTDAMTPVPSILDVPTFEQLARDHYI